MTPPNAGTVKLRGGAKATSEHVREQIEKLGRDRVLELLAYHGFDGPLPYDDKPSEGDAVHVALLLLRQHIPKDRP